MVQVLLINPPYFFTGTGDYTPNKEVWKPLGILSLAAVLEKGGISVGVLDLMPRRRNLQEVLDLIAREKPQLICITGTTPQIRGIVQLGRAIKDRFGEEITLAAGGPHVSCDPQFIEAFPFFDFILIGEGEITLPQMIGEIAGGRRVEGSIVGESALDLDKLPYPARHLLDDSNYASGPYGADYITAHTTRGCPFRCVYCSSPVERMSKVRYRSPGNVVDEVEQCIRDFGTKFVIFTDDTFTLDMGRVEKICQEMLKRNLPIEWNCETRANLVNKELLSLMKEAGCVEVFFGVESGSERIRNDIINKKVSNESLYEAFSICRKLGITTNAFLMAGFPTETKKELQETWDFCFKARPDIIGIHLTTILPGAPIYDIALKEGKIGPGFWHKYARGEIKDQPIYVPDGLTLEELEDFQKKLYRRFYFRPRWLLKRLQTSLSSWNQLKSDLEVAWQLISRGKSKARSYKEEDYF